MLLLLLDYVVGIQSGEIQEIACLGAGHLTASTIIMFITATYLCK